jgi:hypothetical protein
MRKNSTNPSNNLSSEEMEHIFLACCSYTYIYFNKKINLPNIFLKVISNKHICDVFLKCMDFETPFQVVQYFVNYDPSLHKSKYINMFLNNNKNKLTIKK